MLIAGEEGEEENCERVMKSVTEIDDVLFTLKYCENITFSSIAFIIQNVSLSHSLFFSVHSSLTLTCISITPPSDSTTVVELANSLIVSSSGCNLNISKCSFECVELKGGNGSAINSCVVGGFSLIVVNCSFGKCSAMYGGGVYVNVSGDPSMIKMSPVRFEGNENHASESGNTVYVVWRSIENMRSEAFGSFVTLNEEWNEEGKVETGKGKIVRLSEFVDGGGSEGECKSGFAVCTQVRISDDDRGKVVVAVLNGEEEMSREGCEVEMEGGEVSGEVEMGGSGVGEVNGEGVVVDMGSELKTILERCEDISIVVNVTYGGVLNG